MKDGNDEFLAGDGQEENTAKHCQRLPEEFHPLSLFCSWIFEFVAKRWAEYIIDVVG